MRTVEYPYRRDAHSFIKNGTKQVKDDVGGKGIEIVKEVLVHQACKPLLHILATIN